MAAISLSGAKTTVMQAARSTLFEGDGTAKLTPNSWYEVMTVAPSSSLPIPVVSAVFKTPDSTDTSGVTPAVGETLYELKLTRICKTDAEVTLEEGTIDVTDDCENGYNASILDGYKTISGTLNGFTKFNDETGELEENTKLILGRFFNVVTDDGLGTYTVTPAKNERLILFILLNKDAGVTDTQNFLIVPALLSSLGTGAGLKDAQKRDLSWTKAQGYTSLYQRVAFANDIIG